MIEHHHFDAFMPEAFHGSALDRLFRGLGGVAAPTFLFLAGLALVLMMEGQLARGVDRRKVASSAAGRGLLIVAAAYAFRLQQWAFAFGGAPAWNLLRIDVLNCIGVALCLCAALWALGRSPAVRGVLLLSAACAISLASPLVWHADLSALPTHLADYLNGRSPRALFPLFPWVGFTLAGGAVGSLLAAARRALHPERAESRLMLSLVAGSAALFAATRALDAAPFQLYARSDWWFDSPAYFTLRCCALVWLLAACWLVESAARPLWARLPAGPLLKLGQHSLLIYWAHIELVYGRFTWRLRGTLSLQQASLALAALLAAMVSLAYLVEPALRLWRSRRATPPIRLSPST